MKRPIEQNFRIGEKKGHKGLWLISDEVGGLYHKKDTVYRRLFLLKMIVKSVDIERKKIIEAAITMIENGKKGELNFE